MLYRIFFLFCFDKFDSLDFENQMENVVVGIFVHHWTESFKLSICISKCKIYSSTGCEKQQQQQKYKSTEIKFYKKKKKHASCKESKMHLTLKILQAVNLLFDLKCYEKIYRKMCVH